MKGPATIAIILGVCLGALGAAGFHVPAGAETGPEPYAIVIFVAGTLLLLAGGGLSLSARRSGKSGIQLHEQLGGYRLEIEAIRRVVTELDERREELDGDELRLRIGKLLSEELFDLTSKSDDLIALVGFKSYAHVWEGVATAERLLARCWSMCTDGYPEEGREELPHARASLDSAAAAIAEEIAAASRWAEVNPPGR